MKSAPGLRSWLTLAIISTGLWTSSCQTAGTAGAPAVASAKAPAKKPHFVPPTAVDCAKVLPAPPAPDTLAGRADIEAVLQAQEWRTPEQVAWAKRIAVNDPFIFGDVLGAWFTRENLPQTAALLKDVDEDRRQMTDVAKHLFARARPWVVDPRVVPCVDKPGNDSYPSGHTASIFTRAGVLAEIFPERRQALFDFAHRAVWGRVQGGVHFPSDLVGGWILAEPFVAELRKSQAFQAQVAKCRAEAAAFVRK